MKTGAEIAVAATGSFGGYLRCESCGSERPLSRLDQAHYYANGWPRCCSYTMRWWTQRQINAGEVPTFGETP